MARVFIGFGSNMGDREKFIRHALQALENAGTIIRRVSRLIETDPVGGPPQGRFLNGAAEIETDLSPHELLKICQAIESRLHRKRTITNGPRTIDLDILLYDQRRIETPELHIPHPRMKDRPFVMQPLQEIAPEWIQQLLDENFF